MDAHYVKVGLLGGCLPVFSPHVLIPPPLKNMVLEHHKYECVYTKISYTKSSVFLITCPILYFSVNIFIFNSSEEVIK